MGLSRKVVEQLLRLQSSVKKWAIGASSALSSGPLPGNLAGRGIAFCLRGESLYPPAGSHSLSAIYISPGCSCPSLTMWGKILRGVAQGSSLKKPRNTPRESQASRRWWCHLRATVHVPAVLAASLCGRQLPALSWGSRNEDLGCLGCICHRACSSAVLVMTSISNIFKGIWGLPRYSLSALEGKIGKID